MINSLKIYLWSNAMMKFLLTSAKSYHFAVAASSAALTSCVGST